MSAFTGKWTLSGSENMDEFMQVMGVNWMVRKTMASAKTTQEWTVNGDKFHIKTVSTFRTFEQEFTLGVEFDELQMDGSTSKSTATKQSETKLLQITKGDGKEVHVTKEVINDELIITFETKNMKKDVKAVRKFKRE